MIAEGPVTLAPQPGVTLEGRLSVPAGATVGVAICHPHPLYGGDMDSPVVLAAVAACAAAGLATLRFNFRGVGASTGAHDSGRGEQGDLEAALDHLAGQMGPGAVAAAGYSFGSMVTAAVAARRPSLCGVALIAPPLAAATKGLDALGALEAPLLIVVGAHDTYCPRDVLDAALKTLPRAEVHVLDGADHFFGGALRPLGQAVEGWARGLRAG